jgi:hemerythrin
MKFQVGDKVRIEVACSGTIKGKVYILQYNPNDSTDKAIYAWENGGGCSCQEKWELIERGPSMNKYNELKQRIEALDNGWTKEADEILQELTRESKHHFLVEQDMRNAGYIFLCKYDSGSGVWLDENTEKIKPSIKFRFCGSCEKMTAFKDALLWLLDHSDIKKSIVGQEVKVEIEYKVYKARIIEET